VDDTAARARGDAYGIVLAQFVTSLAVVGASLPLRCAVIPWVAVGAQ